MVQRSSLPLQQTPFATVKCQSCLIQDEPGGRIGFSHKMSLKGRCRMLGVDRQHASRGTVEPGTDPGVFGGQRWGAVRGPESRGGVWLGGPNAPAAGLRGTGASRPRIGATLPGEDDGTEPRAGNAPDHAIPGRGGSQAEAVPPAPVPDAVHAGRRRVAGQRGRGARDAERTGHAEVVSAGVL